MVKKSARAEVNRLPRTEPGQLAVLSRVPPSPALNLGVVPDYQPGVLLCGSVLALLDDDAVDLVIVGQDRLPLSRLGPAEPALQCVEDVLLEVVDVVELHLGARQVHNDLAFEID